MKVIWATRGRQWGFRFLRSGGLADPLPAFESAFAGGPASAQFSERSGKGFIVRFPDPSDRRDRAGRPISHEFVIQGSEVTSCEQAQAIAEQAVREEYTDEVWAAEKAPRPLP